MSMMVERIARMISKQDGLDSEEASDFADFHWEERETMAREIIAAMREPTKEMIEAAEEAHSKCWSLEAGEGYDVSPEEPIWRAMIDAALKTEPAR